MPRRRDPAQLAAQVAVIAAVLVSSSAFLDFEDSPLPPPPLLVTSVGWSEAWAPNWSSLGRALPSLQGSCFNASGILSIGPNLTCSFVNREPGFANGGRPPITLIVSVVVAPPFHVLAEGPEVGILGCTDCQWVEVTISPPAGGGAYALAGIVYFAPAVIY